MVRVLLEVQAPQRRGLAPQVRDGVVPNPQVTVDIPQTSHFSPTHHSASGAPTPLVTGNFICHGDPGPDPWASSSTAGPDASLRCPLAD